MKNFWTASIAVCLFAFVSNSALADIIISVDNVTVNAGGTATVEVNATGDENLTAFDIPFDFGNDGFPNIAPTGLTFQNGFSGLPFGTDIFFNPGLNLQEDYIATDVSLTGGTPLSSTPLLLFTMEFGVGAAVPAGTVFDLVVIRDDKFVVNGTSNPGTGTNPSVTVNNGSITVAVPEPSGLILLVASIAGIATRRRRG